MTHAPSPSNDLARFSSNTSGSDTQEFVQAAAGETGNSVKIRTSWPEFL